jgi:large subunit ribosomal protein L13Ae
MLIFDVIVYQPIYGEDHLAAMKSCTGRDPASLHPCAVAALAQTFPKFSPSMEKNEHIVIDATGHILGCLTCFVAKQLLENVKVTVVCAENVIAPHTMKEMEKKYQGFLNKRCATNPRRGPFHPRLPSTYLRRIVRSMIPYKKYKGRIAMQRLVIHDGIPQELINVPRFKVQEALYEYHSKPNSKFTLLGELLHKFSWKHRDMTKKVTEEAREIEKALKDEEARKAEAIEKIKQTDDFKRAVMQKLKSMA